MIQVTILKLCAFDFYQTEDLYTSMLGIEAGESFSEIFEEADFGGKNYIIMIGPIFIYMIIFIPYIIIHQLSMRLIGDKIQYLNKFN